MYPNRIYLTPEDLDAIGALAARDVDTEVYDGMIEGDCVDYRIMLARVLDIASTH